MTHSFPRGIPRFSGGRLSSASHSQGSPTLPRLLQRWALAPTGADSLVQVVQLERMRSKLKVASLSAHLWKMKELTKTTCRVSQAGEKKSIALSDEN